MKIKGDVYFCSWAVQYPALRGITMTRMGAKARGPGNSVCHEGITQSWGSSGCALASLTVTWSTWRFMSSQSELQNRHREVNLHVLDICLEVTHSWRQVTVHA